jgi:hypothetical protein
MQFPNFAIYLAMLLLSGMLRIIAWTVDELIWIGTMVDWYLTEEKQSILRED